MSDYGAVNILANICGQFFSSSSWDDLVHQIIYSGLELVKAQRGTIFLIDDIQNLTSKSKLESLVASGVSGKSLNISAHKGIVGYVFRNQSPVLTNEAQTHSYFDKEIDMITNFKSKEILCVPLKTSEGHKLGALEFVNSTKGGFDNEDLQLAKVLSLFASLAIFQNKKISHLEMRNKRLIEERKESLSSSTKEFYLKSKHKRLAAIYEQLPIYAESDSSILITGESGTGKEVVAKYLHLKSSRKNKPFIAINCAAIPEALFEAELFGVVKGAATGVAERKGKVELASGGTLFLDEVGELPVAIQAKLLRVLQEKVVDPVGAEGKCIEVDFRIIAATNRDLQQMISDEKYREDLYYRLNVLSIELPSLNERQEDIEDICLSIMQQFQNERGWKIKGISPEALSAIRSYHWPGNIRELQNRLERAMILANDKSILESHDFDFYIDSQQKINRIDTHSHYAQLLELPIKKAKDEVEKVLILNALDKTNGNKTKASEILDISREGLRKAMQKLKISA